MVMEVLFKILEKAVEDGKIRLYSKCEDSLIIYLLFVDDLLVFFNGIRYFLTGIFSVMDDFKRISGFEMNLVKLEIFFCGYVDIEVLVLSDLFGFKFGIFLIRYLGLFVDDFVCVF